MTTFMLAVRDAYVGLELTGDAGVLSACAGFPLIPR